MKILRLLPLVLLIGCCGKYIYADLPSNYATLTSIANDICTFQQQYTDLTQSLSNDCQILKNLLNMRKATYQCLETTFNNLTASLQTCNDNTAAENARHSSEVTCIQNLICDLTQRTNTEITTLNDSISSLTEQINQKVIDTNTLMQTDDPTVNTALADLARAKLCYDNAVTERTLFLAQLQTLQTKVNMYKYTADKYSKELADLICKN